MNQDKGAPKSDRITAQHCKKFHHNHLGIAYAGPQFVEEEKESLEVVPHSLLATDYDPIPPPCHGS